MNKALGIINSSGKDIWVSGLQNYRPIGSFSFLGRYRLIDFPISNMSNSDIDNIQVYTGQKPRSLIEHLGTGRHYNINSKSGRLQILFTKHNVDQNYDTDISAYLENLDYIERASQPYVVIAPEYMAYSMNFKQLIASHIESGADITMLYHSVDDAKENHLNCKVLNLNKQKGVLSIEPNRGTAKNRNIFMDTYVMQRELFLYLIHKTKNYSSMYTLADMINQVSEELDIRGYAHRGFFESLTNFKSYFDSNLALIDIKTAQSLFDPEWPIYTRTNDSCPTHYFDTADVHSSVISNGCMIQGTIDHSVIGRGCIIQKGAVIKNSIILAGSTIGEGVYIENQVVDKVATIVHAKKVVSDPEHPGYVKRGDTL